MYNNIIVLVFYRRTGRAGNHGYAYTFITPDKGRYAGDIIRALQLSAADVSDDLQKLWDDYKTLAESVSSIFSF